MSVRLLALDLATNTGYCTVVVDDESVTIVKAGSIRLKEKVAKGEYVPNATAFTKLRSLLISQSPDVIVVESLSPMIAKNTNTAKLLFGMAAVAELWAWDNEVQFMEPVNTQTIKKHAANILGLPVAAKGKDQVLVAAGLLLDRRAKNSDEADAVVLADYQAQRGTVNG